MTTTTTACATIARSRELYAAFREANAVANWAGRLYAYGNGTQAALQAACRSRDAIWHELLALHGISAKEWSRASDSDRQRFWGF